MKWFKHDSNASIDAKLKRVRMKYGMEGYGLYWYCLELIAQTVEKHNLSFVLKHDSELISADINLHQERVQEMMSDFTEWGLFENTRGVITCLKMASRTDEYTQKLMKTVNDVPTLSQPTQDKIRSNRIEKNRKEKKKTEYEKDFITFWEIYPRKDSKKKAADKWKRLSQTNKTKALADIKVRQWNKDKSFILMAVTYLNGERWNDETESDNQNSEWGDGI